MAMKIINGSQTANILNTTKHAKYINAKKNKNPSDTTNKTYSKFIPICTEQTW